MNSYVESKSKVSRDDQTGEQEEAAWEMRTTLKHFLVIDNWST